jgi:hypothetical protein
MIKKYNNFKIINEKISFEEFCSKTQDIKKITIEQNKDIIQTSQQMMYDILDIIGHHIPGLFSIKFNPTNINGTDGKWLVLDAKAEEEYFGEETEFDEDHDDKYLKDCIMRIRRGDEINLLILYQPSCGENGWKPVLLTDELVDANKNVQEDLNSIGVDFEIKESNLNLENGQNGVWCYTLQIPIKLKMSDSLDSSDLNQNILKSFKEFIKKYNIPSDGEIEISNIIRSIL